MGRGMSNRKRFKTIGKRREKHMQQRGGKEPEHGREFFKKYRKRMESMRRKKTNLIEI
jgi:hypothetical protein